jgi:hypothetical protein
MNPLAETPNCLLRWDRQRHDRLLGGMVSTTHRLSELAIFSDSGLATMLDQYPATAMVVTTMGDNPAYPSELRYGAFDGFSGRDWIDMIRRGRLSLRLSDVVGQHQGLSEVVRQLWGEMRAHQPEIDSDSHHSDLWICSPYTMHYLSVAPQPTLFWQIRGSRRVVCYPSREPFVLSQTLEQIVTDNQSQLLYYEPAFEQQSRVVELVPGDVVGLPQHTPHRSANSGTLSITLTTRYGSRRREPRSQILLANRLLNSYWPRPHRSTSIRGPAALAKRSMQSVVNRFSLATSSASNSATVPCEASFRVDPNAYRCVGQLEREQVKPQRLSPIRRLSTMPICETGSDFLATFDAQR